MKEFYIFCVIPMIVLLSTASYGSEKDLKKLGKDFQNVQDVSYKVLTETGKVLTKTGEIIKNLDDNLEIQDMAYDSIKLGGRIFDSVSNFFLAVPEINGYSKDNVSKAMMNMLMNQGFLPKNIIFKKRHVKGFFDNGLYRGSLLNFSADKEERDYYNVSFINNHRARISCKVAITRDGRMILDKCKVHGIATSIFENLIKDREDD